MTQSTALVSSLLNPFMRTQGCDAASLSPPEGSMQAAESDSESSGRDDHGATGGAFGRTRSARRRCDSGMEAVPKAVVDVWDMLAREGLHADLLIQTDDNGGVIAVHRAVLVANSSVLKSLLQRLGAGSNKTPKIALKGAPSSAIKAFIRFLYCGRYDKADMPQYVIHLLSLAYKYKVTHLKKVCIQELESGLLSTENVIDVLLCSQLFQMRNLYRRCEEFVLSHFSEIEKSDGWKVLMETDRELAQELRCKHIERLMARSCGAEHCQSKQSGDWHGLKNLETDRTTVQRPGDGAGGAFVDHPQIQNVMTDDQVRRLFPLAR
ncbi:hypothetical protein CBR_g48887 [Chara braunii]|uniref:BTB domain-containing protein n=1 Tax=Chara braunii TaxID=69332 RepID=A0A388M3L8_CHABU|nr:hypothetical protein CBR_g48887 [Chara braunii]|eukprot:GBG89180.1 hypothetical protein CBR_g48887 [Chara braunii]